MVICKIGAWSTSVTWAVARVTAPLLTVAVLVMSVPPDSGCNTTADRRTTLVALASTCRLVVMTGGAARATPLS